MAGEAAKSHRSLRVIYDAVDVVFERQARAMEKEGQPVRCSDGCDACCYLSVTVTLPEALAIVQRLRMSGRLRAFKEARAWEAQEAVLHEAGMTTLEYMRRRLPCIFLDVDAHRCTVYEDRPGTCRAHAVVTDPDLCAIPDSAIASPDRRSEHEAMMAAGTELASAFDVPNIMLPLAVAMKWALVVHEGGPAALRAALASTAFASDQAIVFYWARLECPDGRTYERVSGGGSILCHVCGTTTEQRTAGAPFCDSCGMFHHTGDDTK